MQLYTLLYGKSKKKQKPIMIDTEQKCKNYRDARASSVTGWHSIVPADPGAVVWKQKTATRGGNKCETVKVIGKPTPGWIGKHGFNAHS